MMSLFDFSVAPFSRTKFAATMLGLAAITLAALISVGPRAAAPKQWPARGRTEAGRPGDARRRVRSAAVWHAVR